MGSEFALPEGLRLGFTGSATQIDGGETPSSWCRWHEQGHMHGDPGPALAAGHWERWRADALLMRSLGVSDCLLGVEWARVEPRQGEFDAAAISRLRDELILLKGLGIEPVLVLHHFSDPCWFDDKGGWENRYNLRYFLRYVETVVRETAHLVSEYITVNEPNLYAVMGYQDGKWPPGKHSRAAAVNVMSVMASAHIIAYKMIHTMRAGLGFTDTRVGYSLRMRAFEPSVRFNIAHNRATAAAERFFQLNIAHAMTTGIFPAPLKNYSRQGEGLYCDFLGLSYYTRSRIEAGISSARAVPRRKELGWEVYPRGIVSCVEKLLSIAKLPVYITGNGVCDGTDAFRCRYIYEHLLTLSLSGLPVERYYHRSFLDGFEWMDGNASRFGLVYVDRDTLARSVKRSGEFYAGIAANRGVTDEMYRSYVRGEEYRAE